jgi:hypothetical protein
MMKPSKALSRIVFVIALASLSTARARAQLVLGDPEHLDVSPEDAESLDVTPKGNFVQVAVLAGDSNTVPVVHHRGKAVDPFVHLYTVDVGPGEITDVAIHPQGLFSIAALRDLGPHEDQSELVVIRSKSTGPRIPVGPNADGIEISPDGNTLVVAVEKGLAIHVYDLSRGAQNIELTAVVSEDAMRAFYDDEDPRLQDDIEPESVAISKDSSFALVSIQDTSSVAAVSLSVVAEQHARGLPPEDVGDLALIDVAHLPFGFVGEDGDLFGVRPDGLSISPDMTFAMTANEGDGDARHLMGLSVLDLRDGLADITVVATHCIFDIDTTLLDDTGFTDCPVDFHVARPVPFPSRADDLPRLDPSDVDLVERGGIVAAVMAIQRNAKDEDRPSVLLMDVSGALAGTPPRKLDRKNVGLGDRPPRTEEIDTTDDARWTFVSIRRDDANLARLELIETHGERKDGSASIRRPR